MMSPADSYRILELSMSASQLEIKAAYHKLVRQWHPDKFHHDPVNHPIAEKKIREINRAFDVLSKSDETQPDADKVSDESPDTYRHGPARSQSRNDDVFYTNLEEAIRSGTNTFANQSQNDGGDAESARPQAATESQIKGRASCAYVGGDPRLEHLATGFLGCSAVVTWNSLGVRLSTAGAASVAYPAHSIRSVRLARRSSLAFLSEGIVRIQVADPAAIGDHGFLIKLRFRDRNTAEFFASQAGTLSAVEIRVDNGWFRQATPLILLLVVLAGLAISIGLSVKRDRVAVESTKPAVVSVAAVNEDSGRDKIESSIAAISQQEVAQTDSGAQIEAVAAIERSGGSVIEIQGKVVRVRLAGARVDGKLLTHISGLRDLEELNLHATTITGEEFRHLSELANLRVLDLGSTQDASAGVKYLTGLTGLQVLCLSNTDVSDVEIKLLEQLPDLQELEVISTQVTKIGIEQFNASRPNCVVVK